RMRPSSLLFMLLQLCCLQMLLLSRPACKLPGKWVETSVHLLILGSLQCRRTLVVLYQFLQGAGAMFAEYDLPEGEGGVTWNNRKLEHYLNLQYRLLNTTETSGVLTAYFSNVTAVVEQQDSAPCGWEALRRDLSWVLKSSVQQHRKCFK
uniref:MHC class I-like antigen recognition-like domain-containing protein n=1 Tax=Oryzias melastigma TaxID=30732 RepID=A0A3B3D3N1_ORYME